MATVVIILENNWSIKIKDKVIYIKNHSGKHKIKYENLISFQRCYRGKQHHTEKVLIVKYLKKNKIIHVILPYADEFELQLEQICEAFITRGDIENGIYIGSEYFDIRDEEQNSCIEKKRSFKIDKNVLLIIILFSNIIVFIMMLIELFKIIK